MRIIVQRVNYASVSIDGKIYSKIGNGILLLVGFTQNDTIVTCEKLAKKVASLRIFEDGQKKMNLGLDDIDGEVLSVSQFTLYANCKKGRRPDFEQALIPDKALLLYEYFNTCLKDLCVKVKTGLFQADMKIELENDGPVTIILDSESL